MSVFSTNQVRHFYAFGTGSYSNNANVRNIGDHFYFVFERNDGGKNLRSDLINKNDIVRAILYTGNTTLATASLQKAKWTSLKLNDNIVPGLEYILRLAIKSAFGMSDDETYIKYGAVLGTAGMSKYQFQVKMALSLVKNLSRELDNPFRVYLGANANSSSLRNALEVTSSSTESSINSFFSDVADSDKENTEFVIVPNFPEWKRGLTGIKVPEYDVFTSPITVSGVEQLWGNIRTAYRYIENKNGHSIADLEYFCKGERGDVYRGAGWPNTIETEYDVDPTKNYSVFEIHYKFKDTGVNDYSSEKSMTIVCPKSEINKMLYLVNRLTCDTSTQVAATVEGRPIYGMFDVPLENILIVNSSRRPTLAPPRPVEGGEAGTPDLDPYYNPLYEDLDSNTDEQDPEEGDQQDENNTQD